MTRGASLGENSYDNNIFSPGSIGCRHIRDESRVTTHDPTLQCTWHSNTIFDV
jgi:hypothetical protein